MPVPPAAVDEEEGERALDGLLEQDSGLRQRVEAPPSTGMIVPVT
jgi:hypothetical protein